MHRYRYDLLPNSLGIIQICYGYRGRRVRKDDGSHQLPLVNFPLTGLIVSWNRFPYAAKFCGLKLNLNLV